MSITAASSISHSNSTTPQLQHCRYSLPTADESTFSVERTKAIFSSDLTQANLERLFKQMRTDCSILRVEDPLTKQSYYLREDFNRELQMYNSRSALLRQLSREHGCYFGLNNVNTAQIEWVIVRSSWLGLKTEFMITEDFIQFEDAYRQQQASREKTLQVAALIFSVAALGGATLHRMQPSLSKIAAPSTGLLLASQLPMISAQGQGVSDALTACQNLSVEDGLFAACEIGCLDVVEKHLNNNFSQIYKVDSMGRTPARIAIEKGHQAIAQAILAKICKDTYVNDGIFDACEKGCLDVVKLLDSKLINQVDSMDRTPLIAATEQGQTYIVQELINKGADPDFSDKDERTALSIAYEKKYIDIELLLRTAICKNISIKSSIFEACEKGCRDTLKTILNENSTLINVADSHERTPLFFASFNGHLDSVIEILSRPAPNHAQINKKDKNGWAPIWIASARGYSEIVEKLLAKGTNIANQADNNSVKPLDIANSKLKEVLAKINKLKNTPRNTKYLNEKWKHLNKKKEDYETIIHNLTAHGG